MVADAGLAKRGGNGRCDRPKQDRPGCIVCDQLAPNGQTARLRLRGLRGNLRRAPASARATWWQCWNTVFRPGGLLPSGSSLFGLRGQG